MRRDAPGCAGDAPYNRFGSREVLTGAVPDLAAAALDEMAERALAGDGPWEGFAGYVADVSRVWSRPTPAARHLDIRVGEDAAGFDVPLYSHPALALRQPRRHGVLVPGSDNVLASEW
ncbi:MAG TPA: hypothetical protein VJT49_17800 [Amycolatopsis sp.]|uniref:hypothetical protein n=1 Tax=Amycolatopsis sp. TaxID=37632 RepID=UPI002B48046F|nr:hypothetical protein [Amycolatopsis sp.]HKS46926.1 hypothetical protein [Amycolatopsis sp.]